MRPRHPNVRRAVARHGLTALVALAASAALAGCALAPVYERPPAPVPARFPDPAQATTDGFVAAELGWRDYLTDPRTQALVSQALQNNRDLRVAVLNVEQARATLGVQQADRLPTLGVGLTAARSSVSDTYSAGFSLSSFEIDLFGRVRSLTDAAASRVLASEQAWRAARLSLIATVADTELALRADDALIELTRQSLASRENSLSLERSRFDAGVIAEPAFRASESLVASARASLAALERQRLQRRNALALLLGGPIPDDLPPAQPLLSHRLAELPAGLPSAVLLARPDVQQAEQLLIAANANIGAARAAFFPRITLTGSAGTASSSLSGLFEHSAWSFTGNLLQPLFDAGRNQSNLQAAQVQRDIAVAQYDKAVQTAFREVADALAARATLDAQLAAQRQQAEAESRRLALVQRLLDAGAASALERLDAERSQLSSQLAVLQLELARRQNALLLYRVLGGGSALAEPMPDPTVATNAAESRP